MNNAKRREKEDAMTPQEKLSPDEQRNLDRYLASAAEGGHTEMVKLLLADGADVHAWNDEALYEAANNGHTETVSRVSGRALSQPQGPPACACCALSAGQRR
jgi:Ankyrin repeats (3 copies)